MFAAFIALFVGGTCASNAQDADLSAGLREPFVQIRQEQNEHREITNVHSIKIKELEQKVVGKPTPLVIPASGKIDYTRYDRLARDCVGVVTPTPAIKDEEAQKLNAKTELEIAKMGQYCLRKQSELAMQKEEEKRRTSQSGQVAPPAPGAMRDEGNQLSDADYQVLDRLIKNAGL